MSDPRGRKRRGEKLDGWLVIDKALGPTSTDVVRRLKYLMKPQKIGHGGTLDPLASGILPIAFGEATKTMPYIVDASKDYSFTLRFGGETETDDLEGAFINETSARPSEAALEAVVPLFLGEIQQIPPLYSAIKLDGARAYDLARQGLKPEIAARPVRIMSLKLCDFNALAGEARFEVTCGKGTYIRSLARDMARAVGSLGHVSFLRRLRVGPFGLERAISLENLESFSHSAPARDKLLALETALDDIPAVALSESEALLVRHGGRLANKRDLSGSVLLVFENQPVALATAFPDGIKPDRVFNL